MNGVNPLSLTRPIGGETVMETSISGRVKNTRVPESKPLRPLFEAISNSIDAIHEAGETKGRIDIEIVRDQNSMFASLETNAQRQLADIEGFVVRDNGIGFTEKNYREFNIADTTNKAGSGGKGVGRFTWLKTFKTVKIESQFFEGSEHKLRKFAFVSVGNGIEGYEFNSTAGEKRETTISLADYIEPYRRRCPKSDDVIAAFIVEEFLDLFVGSSRPKLLLHDPLADYDIDLYQFYDTKMVKQSKRQEYEIKGNPFVLVDVQLHTTHISEHRIYLCARDRAVEPEKLTLPNLPSRLKTEEGEEFIYSVYVSAPILTETVNADRTGFDLPEDNADSPSGELSLSEIREFVREHAKEYLSEYIEPLKQKKRERIEKYASEEGLMFKPILRRLTNAFDDIGIEASDSEIDQRLYQEYQRVQLDLRKRTQRLLEDADHPEYSEYQAFEARLLENLGEISEMNQSALVNYVKQRKAVIEFMRKLLSQQSDGSYSLEAKVHSLICPRGVSSDDILFYDHNLWLVDERLAFYVFLSSDKEIKTNPLLGNESQKTPDILIFDKAMSFVDSPDPPFSAVTVMEFKKPLRKEYSETENPFTQVEEYIEILKAGKARYPDGRELPINPNIPFRSFIVCSLTPQLKKWAARAGLDESPDRMGYFGYMKNYGYVEVMSWAKLVADADKRHFAFFEKLGISAKYRSDRV